MFIVALKGGLGNQLFQYAFARALSVLKNSSFYLDLSWFVKHARSERTYQLDRFNICNNILTLQELENIKNGKVVNISCPGHGVNLQVVNNSIQQFYFDRDNNKEYFIIRDTGEVAPVVVEPKYQYSSEIRDMVLPLWFDGYWQSEKYFQSIWRLLFEEFQLRVIVEGDNLRMAKTIADEPCSVCVHIRRGDAFSNPSSREVHVFIEEEFIHKCMLLVWNKLVSLHCTPHFFIFSDDIKWVKEEFKSAYPFTVVDINDEWKAYYDLYLMSLCKHRILNASTFSWWAAWLAKCRQGNGQVVLAPKKWYHKPELDTKDLLDSSWELIE